MIQRIQSVYLALAAICALLTFLLPYAHFYSDGAKILEYAMFGVFNIQSDTLEMTGPYAFPAWVFGALTLALPLFDIFLYKNRPLQIRLARLAYLLNMAYAIYLFFAIDAVNHRVYDNSLEVLHHVGFYLPVIATVLCFLAVRGIKKDEALVRSLDRIR